MNKEDYGYISEDITLAVGERTKIKFRFMDSITLIYGGMISKDFFSVAVLGGSGSQGYSYNLYYPKDSKSLKIGNKLITIVNVSSDQLKIRI